MSLEATEEVTSRMFYRFRSLSRLLGDNGELATQTIFFPHPKLLNDPMEGYADIFWKGDKVLWINLFRHYLRVFSNCFLVSRLTNNVGDLEGVNYFIDHFTKDFPTEESRILFDDISDLFFSCSAVYDMAEALGARKNSCTEEEVYFHLEAIHDLAFSATTEILLRRELIPPVESYFQSACEEFSKLFDKSLHSMIDEAAEDSRLQSVFAAARHIGESRNTFIEDYPTNSPGMMRLLVREFTSVFLREIRRLIYPEWYAACFMGDYRNASVWGTYGDNYTGVCLIFKGKVTDGHSSISLYRKIAQGLSRGPGGELVGRSQYGYRDMTFNKIDYVAKHVQIDFFKSLGRLSVPVLEADWYSFRGQFSEVAKVDDSDEFRQGYWESFQRTVTKKLNDWSHEDEYRLLISGLALDYSSKEDRVLKYKFEDLDGIIFGMRTPPEKRREIVALIDGKCKAEGRAKFNFYQSYYSSDSGRIEIVQVNTFRGQAQPK